MKHLKRLLLICMMALSIVLTACGGNKTKSEVKETKETSVADSEVTAELSEWNGEWHSIHVYIDAAEVEAVLQEEADEHGESLEEVKEEQLEGRGSNYGGLVVDGNKVTFYEGKIEGNKVVAEADFNFVESVPMEHGGHTMYWFVFESKGDQGPKYLALMDVHGEDTMAHYHMRYMDDIADLNKDDHWYPTYVRASTTSAEAAAMFGHHHDHDHNHDHDHGHDHDHDIIAELSEWDGDWNSMHAYINDEAVIHILEHEAEEHGESLEEVKEEHLEGRYSDYGGLTVDGNKITFYEGKVEDNKIIAEAEFEFKESIPMEHGGHTMYWFIFENKGDQGPKYLALMDVHGEDTMAHYHMRYMDDIADLDKDEHWYPTYLRASTTPEEAAVMFGHSHDHDHDH